MDDRQGLVVLDLEGVLVPEIWIAVAETTGIEALRRTTRDEPDYDALMRYRLALLDRHGLTLSAIQEHRRPRAASTGAAIAPVEQHFHLAFERLDLHQLTVTDTAGSQFEVMLRRYLDSPTTGPQDVKPRRDDFCERRRSFSTREVRLMPGGQPPPPMPTSQNPNCSNSVRPPQVLP